jgi:hypothetical protein
MSVADHRGFVPAEAGTRIQDHEAGNPPAIRRNPPAIHYRIEWVADMRQDVNKEFTAAQLAVLEKLNQADIAHLRRLPQLVVPEFWVDELQYSPFPPLYPGAACLPKLLLVDLPRRHSPRTRTVVSFDGDQSAPGAKHTRRRRACFI